MVSKTKPESFVVIAIKCLTILLQIILISGKYDGITLPSLNEIDQCILCASCWPTHQGINETRNHCTDPATVSNLKYECWPNGDYRELIYHDGKKSDISLIPPSGEKGMCYFNIRVLFTILFSYNLVNGFVLIPLRIAIKTSMLNSKHVGEY